jgi:hypothetical protein
MKSNFNTSHQLLSLLVVGCACVGTADIASPANPHNARAAATIVRVYDLQDDCPNWDAALAIARRKMACDGDGGTPSDDCQEELPCNVCQFLREGAWPPSHIVELPAEMIKGSVYGAVLWDPKWLENCPVGDKTRAEFKQALCYGVGAWGFDKIDTLAKTMTHEALHLCKAIGGGGAAVVDKSLSDYLLCPSKDTADVVELCWRSRN